MTVAVLVPVKDLSRAKTRLANLLSESERADLAGLLLRGVLETIARIGPDAVGSESLRRVVVTAHAPSAALATRLGFEVLPEGRPISESDSVDKASAHLATEGVRGVLRIPLDLPLIELADLERLLALIREGATAVLVPSASGNGTNALYRSPPGLFPSRFGPGSCALHEQEARRVGTDLRIAPLASLALDVDDPDDVRELLRRRVPCAALNWLNNLGIASRLERLREPAAED
jgi:2-phospho-L-lactate/phosphoenolpyruvate guanylyltransferase